MLNQKSHDFAGVGESVEEDFKLVQAEIPFRNTPVWFSNQPLVLKSSADIINLATGVSPLGILPPCKIIHSEDERKSILERLLDVPPQKYVSTNGEQSVKYWGQPFVDSATVTKHLTSEINTLVKSLSEPLVKRVENWLHENGFNVTRIIDPLTGFTYPVGVFRAINVVNNSSVLHLDDFVRDGLMKPDFTLPYLLEGKLFYQVSFNILLDDGGYEPDSLYTYNKFHLPSHEKFVLGNGWQFPLSLVGDCNFLKHTPKVGEGYMFSTSCYHDVKGGSPKSNRITFSCFGIYLPELNLFMLYN